MVVVEVDVNLALFRLPAPAWTDVWICPWVDGHIQATGRDAKGRKQYRYHARFREVRESTKYEHVVAFADALPSIREKVREHMALRGLSRERVLAMPQHRDLPVAFAGEPVELHHPALAGERLMAVARPGRSVCSTRLNAADV